ncbi:MAG: response regulator [Pseudomonadota bacterium]
MSGSVLIAEDEPYILESLMFLMSRAGYRVRAERDGAKAVEAAIQSRPDLLILDIMMPTLNGFEALKQLRATPGLEALQVLVLTAKGQEADRQGMMALGADGFITKPFSNQDLLTTVKALISGEPAPEGQAQPDDG